MILERLKKKFNELVDEDKQPNQQQLSSSQQNAPSSINIAGKLFSKAGNFFKTEYDDILSSTSQQSANFLSKLKNSSSHSDIMDQEILEVLIEENRQMKQVVEKQQIEIEELKEKAETLKTLEEDATEENEMLTYKVLCLEGQAAVSGQDLSEIKILDELKQQKKQMQKEIDKYKQQVSGYENLLAINDQSQNNVNHDPQLQIEELKLLYQLNKEELSKDNLISINISLLMRNQRTYKYFREQLFQKMAKKAIENGEFLYKASSSSSQSGTLNEQSKIYFENKGLKQENLELKQRYIQLELSFNEKEAQVRNIEQKSKNKINKLQSGISKTQQQISNLKNQIYQLKGDQEEQVSFASSFIQPNLQLLSQRINVHNKQSQQKIQEANKAVFEKNKQISDLFMKNTQLEKQTLQIEKQLQDGQQNNKLIYDKNKQIGDLFNQKQQLEQELEEVRERSDNAQQQLKLLKEKLFEYQKQPQVNTQDLLSKNEKMTKEVETLKGEIAQIKHEQVVRSLMKDDPSKNKDVEEARKAVMDKNKIISDMFNKQQEFIRQIEDRDEEVNELRKQLLGNKGRNQPQGNNQELVSKNEKLQKEVDTLKAELAQIKHEQVVRSLMKDDPSKNKEVEEARKAVMDKNKIISDMFNKQQEFIRVIEERDEEINELRSQMSSSKGGAGTSSISNTLTTLGKNNTNQSQNQEQPDFFGGFLKSFWGGESKKETAKEQVQQPEPVYQEIPFKQHEMSFSQSNVIPQRLENQKEVQEPQKQLHFFSNDKKQKDQPKLSIVSPRNEEIQEFIRQKSIELNTDSPQRIFKLQEKQSPQNYIHSTLNFSTQSNENKKQFQSQIQPSHGKPQQTISFKDTLFEQSQNKNPQDIFSQTQKITEVEDDFFESLKPKETKPITNLDFLDDMFSGLLGQTISNQQKQEQPNQLEQQQINSQKSQSQKLGGWTEEDIDIEDDFASKQAQQTESQSSQRQEESKNPFEFQDNQLQPDQNVDLKFNTQQNIIINLEEDPLVIQDQIQRSFTFTDMGKVFQDVQDVMKHHPTDEVERIFSIQDMTKDILETQKAFQSQDQNKQATIIQPEWQESNDIFNDHQFLHQSKSDHLSQEKNIDSNDLIRTFTFSDLQIQDQYKQLNGDKEEEKKQLSKIEEEELHQQQDIQGTPKVHGWGEEDTLDIEIEQNDNIQENNEEVKRKELKVLEPKIPENLYIQSSIESANQQPIHFNEIKEDHFIQQSEKVLNHETLLQHENISSCSNKQISSPSQNSFKEEIQSQRLPEVQLLQIEQPISTLTQIPPSEVETQKLPLCDLGWGDDIPTLDEQIKPQNIDERSHLQVSDNIQRISSAIENKVQEEEKVTIHTQQLGWEDELPEIEVEIGEERGGNFIQVEEEEEKVQKEIPKKIDDKFIESGWDDDDLPDI